MIADGNHSTDKGTEKQVTKQSETRLARLEPAHTVVVDGLNADGNIMIRDPADGSRYEMTRANFLKHWNLTALYR